MVERINDQASRLDAKGKSHSLILEYLFQKTDDINLFKSNCIQNINSLLEKYYMLVSEIRQHNISEEACFELDSLIAT